MSAPYAWIAETLFASTLLMALVLALRGLVAARLGARIAYLLWLLPALRMILPPLPESFGPPPIAQLPMIVELSALPAPAAIVAPSTDWAMIALVIWLVGAALVFVWHLIAYHRFVEAALRQSMDLPELDANGIEVCASRLVRGPFAAGVFLPRIVLPHDWRTRYTAEELRLAMTHEAIHHRRGDLSINLIALAILSLHWFNPIAWRAWRAFRADQELACDALVLRNATGEERHSYATALVKSACRRNPAVACTMSRSDQLKTRLRMMRNARDHRGLGTIVALGVVGGGLALTASGGIAAETTAEIRREVRTHVVAPVVEAVSIVRAMPDPPGAPRQAVMRVHPAPPAPGAPVLPEPPAPMVPPVAATAPVPPAPPAPPAIAMVRVRPVCADGATHSAMVSTDGARRVRAIVCGVPSDADMLKIRLEALRQARTQLAEARAIERAHLAEALADLDEQIAELKAERDDWH
jgi:bla regulator protein blaR1